MEPVTLTTDRLLLRAVGPQDTDAVYAAVQDPDIARWLSQGSTPSNVARHCLTGRAPPRCRTISRPPVRN